MEYTVITGACGGLGGAFVDALAKQGENLLLLGRDEARLANLQTRLAEQYGKAALIYALDLTDASQILAFEKYLQDGGITVCRLIIAAGADIQKPFAEYTQEKLSFQCRVNLEGAMSLCRLALANKAKTLEIVNISSVSGIYPMPYFAVYSATKRALWSFSVSLREETKKDGVKVTAVLPGAMPTRQDICAQIEGQGLWGKLAAKSPQFVVQKSLKAVRKNKRTLIPGFWNKVMYYGTKLIPLSWKLRFIAKRWSKISKDAF